jgi:hypothetical protein
LVYLAARGRKLERNIPFGLAQELVAPLLTGTDLTPEPARLNQLIVELGRSASSYQMDVLITRRSRQAASQQGRSPAAAGADPSSATVDALIALVTG